MVMKLTMIKNYDHRKVMLKIERRKIRHFVFNKRWPFCDMCVMERIIINNKTNWKEAQRAAHAVAANDCPCGKKFISKWDKKSDTGMIVRIQ